jgi:DNA-binding response OmpR family regulator
MTAGHGSRPGVRLLLVEDDRDVRDTVAIALEREGFAIEVVGDGKAALGAVAVNMPDLVVLDLGLPTVDGLDVLEELRRTSDVPTIVLSGRRAEADRVLGLQLGADDYMVKPFSSRELVARINSVLRRATGSTPTRLEFDGLAIDTGTHEVFVGDRTVELTPREFELLAFLAASPRRVFTRPQLLERVWTSSAEWQDQATVTEHVRRVRQKIEDDPTRPRWISSVRGVGYRFNP